jgi:poly(A) polymerase
MSRDAETHTHMPQRLPRADWLASPPLLKVFTAFAEAGQEARIVGGAVRNALMGLPVTDIDLATPARPEEVTRLAKDADLHVYPTGIDHGTVTIVASGHPFEVTTLRRDVATDGRHAIVDFTTDWVEDARRRDFTINAIYAAPDGALFDPTGGVADIERRRVRFIGKPEDRIREDYLRILRFFRFSAAYGAGLLDAHGLAAATALKDGITSLSRERIGAEVLMLLAADRAADVVNAMNEAGILDQVFITPCHPARLAKLVSLEKATGYSADVMARLAALALDGTAANQSAIAETATSLRLSNADAALLRALSHSDAAFDPSTEERLARAGLYRRGTDTWVRAGLVAWARSADAITDTARRQRLTLAERWTPPELPLRGADLLALGVPAGPRLGTILKSFEDWWISADFPGDTATQEHKIRALLEQC